MKNTGIGSIGVRGVGTSSLINTVGSCIAKELQQVAAVAAGATTVTVDWKKYHIANEDEDAVDWPWVDIPGDVCQVCF